VARFWQQLGCRVVSVKPGAALCQMQLVPAGSTTDPLQDTAEPISQVCGSSVETHLRNGKNARQRAE